MTKAGNHCSNTLFSESLRNQKVDRKWSVKHGRSTRVWTVTYLGSIYGNKDLTLEKTIGQACATADAEQLSTHSRSRKPMRQIAHVSMLPTPLTMVGILALSIVLSWESWGPGGQMELPRSQVHCRSMFALAIMAERSVGGNSGRHRSAMLAHDLSITSITGSSSACKQKQIITWTSKTCANGTKHKFCYLQYICKP